MIDISVFDLVRAVFLLSVGVKDRVFTVVLVSSPLG